MQAFIFDGIYVSFRNCVVLSQQKNARPIVTSTQHCRMLFVQSIFVGTIYARLLDHTTTGDTPRKRKSCDDRIPPDFRAFFNFEFPFLTPNGLSFIFFSL